jgi:hypothetical protein
VIMASTPRKIKNKRISGKQNEKWT